MKNKILMIGLLIGTFALASNTYAVGQNNTNAIEMNTQDQQQSMPVASQGENIPLQTQNQTQQQLQNNSQIEDNASIQNQNQVQNQEQEETQNLNQTGSMVSEQRRSQVANAVQTMLQVAERSGGIGEQVRIIAQTQTQNQEQLETSLEKVQKRSGFVKLFFGPDYDEISKAEKVLAQNHEQIEQLIQIKNELANQGDQQILTQQIQMIEQANLEIKNSLGTEQKGFSLLGWMFKMFSK